MSNHAPHYLPFVPHSIEDRGFWDRVAREPATAGVVRSIYERADAAPARPAPPVASDYLAARRSNDRQRLDQYWRRDRITLGALVLRRCLLGLDAGDPDDRLLDWLFSMATHPTWVVSAHLPQNDLPLTGAPQLDLAATEMAGVLAETLEVLRPWVDAQSQTLADTIVREIDRRVLEPFARDGGGQFWARDDHQPHRNNWTGVCAGSILAACESLARQGQPRPEARDRALRLLDVFFREAFTPTGECDEGVMYWNYGLEYACVGLCRLEPDELARRIDLRRLAQVASYPGRAHLFDTTFYAGNDSGSTSRAGATFVPWLAQVTGDAFLRHWVATTATRTTPEWRDTLSGLRCIDALLHRMPAVEDAPAPAARAVQYLDDQQVMIARATTSDGRELLVALGGGSNAERHNHNDVGHFIVAVDGRVIVPDMGAPHYTADFFGPRRYTYVPASSRGHCCPIVNGHEQRAGADTVATVLRCDVTRDMADFAVDATAAYPPDAGLARWTRALRRDGSTMTLRDEYRLRRDSTVTQVIWFNDEPREKLVEGGLEVRAGGLVCTLRPAPASHAVAAVDGGSELRLRDYKAGERLYRLEAVYPVAAGELGCEVRFEVGDA